MQKIDLHLQGLIDLSPNAGGGNSLTATGGLPAFSEDPATHVIVQPFVVRVGWISSEHC